MGNRHAANGGKTRCCIDPETKLFPIHLDHMYIYVVVELVRSNASTKNKRPA